MGTSKHLVILLAAALCGILLPGSGQPAAAAPSSQGNGSNTRFASCIVRITADPALLPLDLGSIESLLQSSGVVYKAAREVLSLNIDKPEDFALIKVEWLNASSAPIPPGARPSRQTGRGGPDEEMRRQMEQVYGRDYMQQMMGLSREEKGGGTKEDHPAESPQREGASGASGQSPSGDFGMPGPAGTTATGGMGMARGMGGHGGGMLSGTGGMGMGGGALSAQEPSMNPSRLPGESDVAYRTRLLQARAQQAKLQAVTNREMGGYGGGMAGGTGGYGGGMRAGMGGYGGMGFYGAPGAARQGESLEQSATVQLRVDLPEELPPRADEFLGAVVTNLRESLRQAYESCRTDIEQMLVDAKTQYQFVESRLDGTTGAIPPATLRIRQQLDMEVDLSQLSPQTPLAAAIEILRKSVEPPVNIVVLWKDVETNLFVQPSSPANFEGSPRTRLGTALDLLVKGLYDGSAKPMWKIRDDTIVIGTAATLGQAQEAAAQSQVAADAVNLAGERSELARRMQTLELDLAGLDARQKAVQEQIAATQAAAGQRLAEDSMTRELQRLLAASEETLAQLKKAADAGRTSMVEVSRGQEGVAKARIDLARRQEELTRQAGGGQLEEFTRELSRMAIDKAEKEAQLQIVRKQLDDVQKQLMQALTFDPEAARLRLAQEALEITGRRVAELQTQLANLQPPTVLLIGAN
jgi:hypothetical protein